jgi:predicted P-loop ATPase
MKDRIWAAACVVAETDFSTWITTQEEQTADVIRHEFTDLDPWHACIKAFLEGRDEVTVQAVWEHVSAIGKGHAWERKGDVANLDKGKSNRIGRTLRHLGWKRTNGIWRPSKPVSRKPHQAVNVAN